MFPNKAENKGKRKWTQCPFCDGRLHRSDFKIGQSKHEVPLRIPNSGVDLPKSMYDGFAALGRQPMAKANVKLAAVRSKRANLARSSAADEDGANSKIQADLLLASSTPRPTVASTQSATIGLED
jgi:hypothetical protein